MNEIPGFQEKAKKIEEKLHETERLDDEFEEKRLDLRLAANEKKLDNLRWFEIPQALQEVDQVIFELEYDLFEVDFEQQKRILELRKNYDDLYYDYQNQEFLQFDDDKEKIVNLEDRIKKLNEWRKVDITTLNTDKSVWTPAELQPFAKEMKLLAYFVGETGYEKFISNPQIKEIIIKDSSLLKDMVSIAKNIGEENFMFFMDVDFSIILKRSLIPVTQFIQTLQTLTVIYKDNCDYDNSDIYTAIMYKILTIDRLLRFSFIPNPSILLEMIVDYEIYKLPQNLNYAQVKIINELAFLSHSDDLIDINKLNQLIRHPSVDDFLIVLQNIQGNNLNVDNFVKIIVFFLKSPADSVNLSIQFKDKSVFIFNWIDALESIPNKQEIELLFNIIKTETEEKLIQKGYKDLFKLRPFLLEYPEFSLKVFQKVSYKGIKFLTLLSKINCDFNNPGIQNIFILNLDKNNPNCLDDLLSTPDFYINAENSQFLHLKGIKVLEKVDIEVTEKKIDRLKEADSVNLQLGQFEKYNVEQLDTGELGRRVIHLKNNISENARNNYKIVVFSEQNLVTVQPLQGNNYLNLMLKQQSKDVQILLIKNNANINYQDCLIDHQKLDIAGAILLEAQEKKAMTVKPQMTIAERIYNTDKFTAQMIYNLENKFTVIPENSSINYADVKETLVKLNPNFEQTEKNKVACNLMIQGIDTLINNFFQEKNNYSERISQIYNKYLQNLHNNIFVLNDENDLNSQRMVEVEEENSFFRDEPQYVFVHNDTLSSFEVAVKKMNLSITEARYCHKKFIDDFCTYLLFRRNQLQLDDNDIAKIQKKIIDKCLFSIDEERYSYGDYFDTFTSHKKIHKIFLSTINMQLYSNLENDNTFDYRNKFEFSPNNDGSDDIIYNFGEGKNKEKVIWKKVYPGTIIMRPYDGLQTVSSQYPGDLEHGMIYIGKGEVISQQSSIDTGVENLNIAIGGKSPEYVKFFTPTKDPQVLKLVVKVARFLKTIGITFPENIDFAPVEDPNNKRELANEEKNIAKKMGLEGLTYTYNNLYCFAFVYKAYEIALHCLKQKDSDFKPDFSLDKMNLIRVDLEELKTEGARQSNNVFNLLDKKGAYQKVLAKSIIFEGAIEFQGKNYTKQDIINLLAEALSKRDFPGLSADKDKIQKWLAHQNDDIKYFLTNMFYYTGPEMALGAEEIKFEKIKVEDQKKDKKAE